MGEEFTLSDSNLVDASELFGDQEETKPTEEVKPENTETKPAEGSEKPEETGEHKEETKEENKGISTTEVKSTAEDLFGSDAKPEEVGGEKNNTKGIEEPEKKESTEVSPNIMSSFAKALHDDGQLSALTEDEIGKITNSADLSKAIDKEVNSRLTEKQKKIAQALDGGIPADNISKYTNIITNLGKISNENLEAENDGAKNLRENIIYQDFINRGITPDRAKSLVERSVTGGNDIEDAKVALEENKKFFQTQFDNLTAEAAKKQEEEKKKIEEEAETLKKSMLDNDELFKGIKVEKPDRQKAYDALTKPVATGKDGTPLTAIQKYAEDNPVEFRKILGMTWAVTDGFKGMDKLVNKQVTEKVHDSMKKFEEKLKGGSNNLNGNIKYVESGKQDEHSTKSLFDEGWVPDA